MLCKIIEWGVEFYMKKSQQLEKLFGRELNGDDLVILAKVFGRSIDSLFKDIKDISIQPLDNMPTRSMLSDKKINSNEFEYHWQKLSGSRQIDLADKLQDASFSRGYDKKSSHLSDLIETVGATMGDKMIQDLYDAIGDQEHTVAYLHYNKGYLDGIKFFLIAGQL